MSKSHQAMGLVFVAVFGLWGCSRGPTSTSAQAERIKALEAKNARLEDDFRSVTSARDQFRKKLISTEESQALLEQEIEKLRPVLKERDDLRVQVKTRTAERDLLQNQYEGFRKSIRDLLAQAESALNRPADPLLPSPTKPSETSLNSPISPIIPGLN